MNHPHSRSHGLLGLCTPVSGTIEVMSKEEKRAAEAAEEASALASFLAIGLDDTVAKWVQSDGALPRPANQRFNCILWRRNASVNPKFRKSLLELIDEAGAKDGLPKTKGNLLYYVAGKVSTKPWH